MLTLDYSPREHPRVSSTATSSPLRDCEYGERQAALTDPFGHDWVLTQALADTAQEQWGGQTITSR